MNEHANATGQNQGPFAKEQAMEKIPPRAPLAFRIGVTGHRLEPKNLPDENKKRPDPDIPAIRQAIQEVLGIISVSFKTVADTNGHLFDLRASEASQVPGGTLRIVSALACGADQWVAEEALKLGFELQCILPFKSDEYRKDFTGPDEAVRYDELLKKAAAVLELDGKLSADNSGDYGHDSRSYEAAGRALLNQTDLLIAIWDGKDPKGLGGTGQVVYEALQNGIPVVRIPWSSPGTWKLQNHSWNLYEELDDLSGDSDRLSEMVEKLLLPPLENTQPGVESGKSLRTGYFEEKQKKGNIHHGMWSLFQSLICAELFKKDGPAKVMKAFQVKDFVTLEEEKSNKFWNKKSEREFFEQPIDEKIQEWIKDRYLKHYAWANGLSLYYGNMHRSALLLNYLFGATAVFLALICIATGISGKLQTGWIIAELLVIMGILALTHRGRKNQWHQRWIDYRTLAEYLRLSRSLILVGGGRPQVAYEGHLSSYGNPANTWMNWHCRAIERAAGIPSISFTGGYLASCQELWRDGIIKGQVDYHQGSFIRFKKIDKRLHRASDRLFIATLLACFVHLAHIWLEYDQRFDWIPEKTGNWMVLLCAFLPALGAAFAAIRSHSEVQRLAQRSKAMEETLTGLKADLAKVPVAGNALNSAELRKQMYRVSNLMTNEMLDWRVVFQDRPLGLPA